nr:hypothetical protein Q903MT_gene1201 [Picea sitchensis]
MPSVTCKGLAMPAIYFSLACVHQPVKYFYSFYIRYMYPMSNR